MGVAGMWVWPRFRRSSIDLINEGAEYLSNVSHCLSGNGREFG